MADFQTREERREERRDERRRRREACMERYQNSGGAGTGHVWTGGFLLVIGAVALARSMGVPMPVWLFSWQMLLIAIGLFIGIRKGFRDGGWFVPILIGGIFLVNSYFLNGQLHRHMWPLILIIIGITFIFRANNKTKQKWQKDWNEKKNTGIETSTTTTTGTSTPINPVNESTINGEDDYISITSIFGGTEKTIISKNFKGGNMVNIFGGSEISFTQSDLNGTAFLDVTCIFGGATLIVPSNWVVRSDAVTIFGGIGDKRKSMEITNDGTTKALIIKGTIMFGGLEIKSF